MAKVFIFLFLCFIAYLLGCLLFIFQIFVQILHILFIAWWLPFFCIPRVQKFYNLVISFYNLVLPHFLPQWLTHVSLLLLLIRYADFCSCTQLASIFLRHIISNSMLGYIPFKKGNPPKFTSLPAAYIRQGRLDYDTHLPTVCWMNINYSPMCMTVLCKFTRVIKLTSSKYSSNDITTSNTTNPYHLFDDAQ